MLIRYAQVSTDDQDLALQMDALRKAGCQRTFTDKTSGTKSDRPGLAEALSHRRAKDVLVVLETGPPGAHREGFGRPGRRVVRARGAVP